MDHLLKIFFDSLDQGMMTFPEQIELLVPLTDMVDEIFSLGERTDSGIKCCKCKWVDYSKD